MQVKFSSADRVLVVGLGLQGGGVGVARFLALLGLKVVITDIKTKKELAPSLKKLRSFNIQYVLGKHRVEDFLHTDFIVKNPAVPNSLPALRAAKHARVPITNDADIFFSLLPRERIIGITGTKGKTTTASLIAHLLGTQAVLVGTPGVSFFDVFTKKTTPNFIVAELSSFDLEYVRQSPHVAVITSLFADHLNRYASMSAYAHAKMNLVRYQTKNDVVFLGASREIKKYLPHTKAGTHFVHTKKNEPPQWSISADAASLASTVAHTLNVPTKTITQRLSTFRAPKGRLETVSKKFGITFINDTTSTNPTGAVYSLGLLLKKFKSSHKIAVITGGEDKNFPKTDIQNFAKALKKARVDVICLPGSFTKKLTAHLSRTCQVQNMREAIHQSAKAHRIVALIPAAASFNLFKNEFDRGESFVREIRALKKYER